jgi:hypothetical protein
LDGELLASWIRERRRVAGIEGIVPRVFGRVRVMGPEGVGVVFVEGVEGSPGVVVEGEIVMGPPVVKVKG